MFIDLNEIVIRDFERKDAPLLFKIVREPGVLRFMNDWSQHAKVPSDYYEYIDWLKKNSTSTDFNDNMRYAVALKETDELIGMVGAGLENTVNEVEVAYFMSEKYQRKGYTKRAVDALVDWCFKNTEIPYLILTIDCANNPSRLLAKKCGFELFEKRTPINHKQPNMESDSYYYFRKYRK